jgi:hypothetical protein
MERTDQDFKDGLALDLFSPKNRTLVVKQNTSPLPEVSRGSAVTQCALPLIKTIKLDSAGSYITLSLLCGVFHISLIGDNTVL